MHNFSRPSAMHVFVDSYRITNACNAADCNEVSASKCCENYPDLGKCLPGEDDKPDTGKCWKFCSTECKGAKCQLLGHRHQCHCLC
ncbi:hypothetical protein WN943_019297 [Citrus x changshan-huyou]